MFLVKLNIGVSQRTENTRESICLQPGGRDLPNIRRHSSQWSISITPGSHFFKAFYRRGLMRAQLADITGAKSAAISASDDRRCHCNKSGVTSSVSEQSYSLQKEERVRFYSKDGHCVPYSYFNIKQLNRKKRRAILKSLPTYRCSLRDFSRIVCGLERVKFATIEWILSQTSGKYLVADEQHCVSVDCGKQILFCPGEHFVLKLCVESFARCGLKRLVHVRKVTTD